MLHRETWQQGRTRKPKPLKAQAKARPRAERGQGQALWVLGAVGLMLAVGGFAWLAGWRRGADAAWALAVLGALVPLSWRVIDDLRRGKTGVDIIALLAMAGALVLGQYLAGAVVGVMLSGGQALEGYAGERAKRELRELLARAPRIAHRYEDGRLVDPPIGSVGRGDRLLVKPGEVVPVDGALASEAAVTDESALTGESRMMEHIKGDLVRSGAVNAGAPFDMHALRGVEESTYAGIVRLVAEASQSKSPFVRLADRYAMWFLPLTLAVAAGAWGLSHDPVRALAVLVVATPCPLILAAPVAIVGGISRAANRGIIVKGGGALETLARARTLVFDKTGTLTAGTPRVASVEAFGDMGADEVVRLAGSLDQVSAHVFAGAIVAAAQRQGQDIVFPESVKEHGGRGVEGLVGGRRVALGKASWLAEKGALPTGAERLRERLGESGLSSVFVAVDSVVVGALVIEDPIRKDTPEALRKLRALGVGRVVLLSGDRMAVAKEVGRTLGVDEVKAEKTPLDKVQGVLMERDLAVTVMVGDGVNDAPALAAADVGVAMGARGASASSEAADVVIVVDSLSRVAEAVEIAQRARKIAVQSVLGGMGLSVVGMVLASVGVLPPVAGAIFQEVIDVAVVLNALRALSGGRHGRLGRTEGKAGAQATVETASGTAAAV